MDRRGRLTLQAIDASKCSAIGERGQGAVASAYQRMRCAGARHQHPSIGDPRTARPALPTHGCPHRLDERRGTHLRRGSLARMASSPQAGQWRRSVDRNIGQMVLLWVWHATHAAAMPSLVAQMLWHSSLLLSALLFWRALVPASGVGWQSIFALLVTGKLVCRLAVLLVFSPRLLYFQPPGAATKHAIEHAAERPDLPDQHERSTPQRQIDQRAGVRAGRVPSCLPFCCRCVRRRHEACAPAHRGYGHGLGRGHGDGAGGLGPFLSRPGSVGGIFWLLQPQGCAAFGCRVGERKRKPFARRGRGKHATLAGVMMAPWLPSTLLPCRTAQDRVRDWPPAGARVRPSPIDAGIGGESRLSRHRAGSGTEALWPAPGLLPAPRDARTNQPGRLRCGREFHLAHMSVNRWE